MPRLTNKKIAKKAVVSAKRARKRKPQPKRAKGR